MISLELVKIFTFTSPSPKLFNNSKTLRRLVMMSQKVRPPEIEKDLYDAFKKHCIDKDLETGEALEKAIKQFMKKEE